MSASQPKSDPIPPFAQQVLAVYAEQLPDVRFPDLDLGLLETSAAELRAAQLEAERIEAELEAARAAVRTQAELLQCRAERTLAYARVFADGDAALSERLADIGRSVRVPRARTAQFTEGMPAAPPKKRGRPRKSDHDTNLFGAPEAPVPAGAAEHAA
jgi:hypothetical protein